MKSQRVKEHNCPADKRNVVEPAGEWSEEDVLGQLSGPDSLVLLDRWKSDGSVRMLAAAALDSAVNSGSRWFATRYLGEFTDEEAVGALERLLSDDEMRLREQAARSLGEVGPDARPALPALVRALFDGEGPVRVAAARTLGRIGDAVGCAGSPQGCGHDTVGHPARVCGSRTASSPAPRAAGLRPPSPAS